VVNCEAELPNHVLFDKRVPNQIPCEVAETDSRAKFGKETVAGVHRRSKSIPHYSAQANSGRAQDTQALLRHAQALIRYAHLRLRYAHPQLRSKQWLLTSKTKMEAVKGKINPESMGIHWSLSFSRCSLFGFSATS
jgi:hypothetical protein